MTKGPKPTDVLIRIMRRVDTQENGCWIFTGCRTRTGYGQVTLSFTEGRALTHRVVYERMEGPVPEGMQLDHLCRMPACCNPEHLEPVTPAENIRRGNVSAVQRARFALMKTCRKGHERNEANIYHTKDGKRRCRPCQAEWARNHKAVTT
jgi:hypothetical protein